MVNLEIVRSRLGLIEEMLRILRDFQQLSIEDYLKDRKAQLAAEHSLYLAIQSLLDLSSHILADQGVRNIADYRDVIIKLGQSKVIPSFFPESIADMAGFRNRLIHEYEDVDPKKVFEFLQNRLGDFEEFMKYIRDHFRLA